ncbi:helix-turn-helix domain-containing protein [Taklimakanibacter deserti]|uniref:helix-turn-helix domain-containing protein n=1 Tax=Taklimakanibacter deserti TaxID=2267839 RepID=UPI000E65AA46
MDVDHPICRGADGQEAQVFFRRYAPPPEIRSFVESLWTFEAGAGGKALTDYILPDLATEIICRMDGQVFMRGPRLHLEEITIAPKARYMGARLRPGVAPELFKLAARDACGSRLALEDMGCLVAASSQGDFTRSLVDLFRRRGLTGNRIARRAVDIISRPRGRISVDAVATALGCSTRHLHREMIADLGMGPKTVARIARLRRAITLLDAGHETLAATAADAGYADQAHMTREFSLLRMPSPARWRQWRESDFINTSQA